ncbi:variant surface glycoprotein (VSG), putative [Trypanosoma brucei brucei TREU927]|uniref:Variant surface glycoprotein (VSG), putative n=1 Tax=Trypanosoma brucei brucei (strain 927/4 GUTat10.1) TaxID=185431 RepID=Q57TR6_TRYB2|nr:variant surface glycoprotein (VSG), putative [Trypanosoma brucei brucei TREU927]AAX81087.1 variant surface glycoprotein (VSG), putative [Trypanosoma brucei]AAZ10087.1 variant surface glycoprotein (VSG), putative [Trypanosoma brucei brucei TREU927]
MKAITTTIGTLWILSAHWTKADTNAADNEPDFTVLCSVLDVATGKPALNDIPTKWRNLRQQLTDINISLSTGDWTKHLLDTDGNVQEWTKAQQAGKLPEDWATEWPAWAAAAKRSAKGGETHDKLQASGIPSLDAEQRKEAAQLIKHLLNSTQPLMDALQGVETAEAATTAAALAATLDQSVYGDKPEAHPGKQASAAVRRTATRGICASGAKIGTSQALADALLCLCWTDTGSPPQGQGSVCRKNLGNTLTSTWDTASATVNAAYAQIKGACKLQTGHTITAANIAEALAAVKHKIAQHKEGGYLGKYEGDFSCDGKNANGVCIKYADFSDKGNKAFEEIEWVKKLRSVETALRKREAAVARVDTLTTALETQTAAAWLIPQRAKSSQQKREGVSPKQHTSTGNGNKQQADQCEAIKKATECKEKQPNCEWQGKNDEDGPHCKVNKTHITKEAAQTGTNRGNEETTTDKCSQAKTSDECAAVKGDIPKDKKSVCGWIEGKCQNSRFPVNKKLTLMVSAFVSIAAF